MEIITQREGKKKGQNGITIHLLKQNKKEMSRSITVHGITIEELYEKLLFFLFILKDNIPGTVMKIIVSKDLKNKVKK